MLALFPFVLVLTKSSSVVGVASLFSFVGSFSFVHVFLCLVCFVSFVVRCTTCRITSRRGYTTATRWGGTTAILLCRPGVVFSSIHRGFILNFFTFAFFPAYLFAYFEVITLALSPYVFSFPFLLVCFFILLLYSLIHFSFYIFVFLSSFSVSG